MIKPRALVLTGYGINCDIETEHALYLAGANAKRIHINDLKEGRAHLKYHQIFAIPGGFSFGDDIASGIGLAKKLSAYLGDEIEDFIDRGNLVIGICNGAQTGIKYPLHGLDKDGKQAATLTFNDSGRFEARWVNLQIVSDKCVWTQGMDTLELPVAHGEGKFYASDKILQDFYAKDQVVLKYIGNNGRPANRRYPENPNGSVDDIAGICDPTGRIFVLMPHPERYIHPYQHPQWTRQKIEGRLPKEGAGLQIFRNGVKYFG